MNEYYNVNEYFHLNGYYNKGSLVSELFQMGATEDFLFSFKVKDKNSRHTVQVPINLNE